jgi:hypothetical protein
MSLSGKTIKYIWHYYYYSIVFACSSLFTTNENEKKMTTAVDDLPFFGCSSCQWIDFLRLLCTRAGAEHLKRKRWPPRMDYCPKAENDGVGP